MTAEHLSLDGLRQGYYCRNCGGTTNAIGTGHILVREVPYSYLCEARHDLVRELDDLNESLDLEPIRQLMLEHGFDFETACEVQKILDGNTIGPKQAAFWVHERGKCKVMSLPAEDDPFLVHAHARLRNAARLNREWHQGRQAPV
jgi:hypothetical protein